MRKVVIYPGRFQPMLAHHAEVYRQLQSQFPDADVFVATSDKVESPNSPFNFKEKKAIASLFNITNIIQVRSPYNGKEYVDKFDPDNTVLIFAVGEKDYLRFPFNNTDSETGLEMTTKGAPGYLQKINTYNSDPVPMKDRAYITLAPTIKTGSTVASASAFRDALSNAPDAEAAKKIFVRQYGEYNDLIFNMMYNKIGDAAMAENINRLRKLAGLTENFDLDESDRGITTYENPLVAIYQSRDPKLGQSEPGLTGHMNLKVAARIYELDERAVELMAKAVHEAGVGEKVRVPDKWVSAWKQGYRDEGLPDPGELWLELSQHHDKAEQDDDPTMGNDPWNELGTWKEKDKINQTESKDMSINDDINRIKHLAGLMEGPSIPFNDRPEFDPKNSKDGPLDISDRDQRKADARPDAAANSDPKNVVFSEPGKKSSVSSIANRFDDPTQANDFATKKHEFLKALLSSPGALLGEIAERLSPADDNSLAVGDRLLDIINTLNADEYMSFTDLPDADKQFAINAVASAIKSMDLVAGSPEKDTYDPGEPAPEVDVDAEVESVNFDGIREEYGISEGEGWQDDCPSCEGNGCEKCDFTGKKELPEAVEERFQVRYLPNDSDKYKIEKGFTSRAEANAWIKGENLRDRADEVDIESESISEATDAPTKCGSCKGSGEKYDIAKNSEQDMSDVMGEMKKLAGLPIKEAAGRSFGYELAELIYNKTGLMYPAAGEKEYINNILPALVELLGSYGYDNPQQKARRMMQYDEDFLSDFLNDARQYEERFFQNPEEVEEAITAEEEFNNQMSESGTVDEFRKLADKISKIWEAKDKPKCDKCDDTGKVLTPGQWGKKCDCKDKKEVSESEVSSS